VITGSFKGSYQSFFEESSEKPDQDFYSEVQLKINISNQLTDTVQYVASPLMQEHNEDWVEKEFRMVEDAIKRPGTTFHELYFLVTAGDFELSMGKKILSWGVADGCKATDVINPKDFMSVADTLGNPDQHKIGVPVISLFLYGSMLNLQVVSVPIFTPNRLPLESSRWSTTTSSSNPTTDIIWDRELPTREQTENQGGLQLSSSSLAEGWDLALNYYQGFSPVAVLVTKSVFPEIEIGLVYPEFHQVGFNFSTVWGDFEFHGEIAFHETRNELEDVDYEIYVLGLNYSWIYDLPDFFEKLNFILEFVDKEISRERPDESPYYDSGGGQPANESINGRIEVGIDADTKIELMASVNYGDENGYFFRTKLTHNLKDDLEIQLKYDAFDGTEESYFGRWKDNDQASMTITCFF